MEEEDNVNPIPLISVSCVNNKFELFVYTIVKYLR